jgi:hypothetical protein
MSKTYTYAIVVKKREVEKMMVRALLDMVNVYVMNVEMGITIAAMIVAS